MKRSLEATIPEWGEPKRITKNNSSSSKLFENTINCTETPNLEAMIEKSDNNNLSQNRTKLLNMKRSLEVTIPECNEPKRITKNNSSSSKLFENTINCAETPNLEATIEKNVNNNLSLNKIMNLLNSNNFADFIKNNDDINVLFNLNMNLLKLNNLVVTRVFELKEARKVEVLKRYNSIKNELDNLDKIKVISNSNIHMPFSAFVQSNVSIKNNDDIIVLPKKA